MPLSLFKLEDLISFADAARLRGVSRQSITKLVAKGRFNPVSIGGREFLNRMEVESYKPLKAGRPFRNDPNTAYMSPADAASTLKVAEKPSVKYGTKLKKKK